VQNFLLYRSTGELVKNQIAHVARVGQNCIFGDFPAENAVHTPFFMVLANPYICCHTLYMYSSYMTVCL